MDISNIVQFISSVGFPIFACFALFWYMTKQREEHKVEIDKMVEAINNNTLILTKIESQMRGDDN